MWFRRTKPPENPEADKALGEARETLREVKARGPEVRRVAEASREFRRQNHFALDLQSLFEGGSR